MSLYIPALPWWLIRRIPDQESLGSSPNQLFVLRSVLKVKWNNYTANWSVQLKEPIDYEKLQLNTHDLAQ